MKTLKSKGLKFVANETLYTFDQNNRYSTVMIAEKTNGEIPNSEGFPETSYFDGHIELSKNKAIESFYIKVSKENLKYLSLAIPESDPRPYLNNLAVYTNGTLAASDGHRLHTVDHNDTFDTENILIPFGAIKKVLQFMDSKSDGFELHRIAERLFKIVIRGNKNITVYGYLSEGKFPNIERVIPSFSNKTILNGFNRKKLKDLIPFSNQYEQVSIDLKSNCITVPNDNDMVLKDVFGKSKDSETIIKLSLRYFTESLSTKKYESETDNVFIGKEKESVIITNSYGDRLAVVTLFTR